MVLSTLFPRGPHSINYLTLDIIVADAEVLDIAKGLGDPYADYNRNLNNALDGCLDAFSCLRSPSEIVQSPKLLADIFAGDNPQQIYLNRPGGASVVIFNPNFATLKQHLDHPELIQVSPIDVQHAIRFAQHAIGFFNREDAIKKAVHEATGERGNWKAADNTIKSDNHWVCGPFGLIFLEQKDWLGLDGDATTQAVLTYSKIISNDKYKPYRQYSKFPSILLGITANRIEISVAVCVGPIYVTKLLTLDIDFGVHASANIIRLARVFGALSRCRASLIMYYEEVLKLASPKLSSLYPNPTAVDPSQKLPKLTYRQFLSGAGQPTAALDNLGRVCTAIYTATLALDDGTEKEVIVKFTARYNEAAHRLLAEAGLAPTLYFCGLVVGGLYMIVMERVDGKSIWQLQEDKAPVPAIVVKKVGQAVDLLHKNDIVFGDLRNNNVLYVASKGSVVLVDFDWSGKDGESRYPVTFISGTCGDDTWADGVSGFGIMRKTHDLWQLDQLKDLSVKSHLQLLTGRSVD